MKLVNEHDLEYRNRDSGPKYLFRGPGHEWGIILFHAGQALGAHRHQQVEEVFYFERGAPLLVVDGHEHRVREGDAVQLEAGEAHDIINDTDGDVRIIFIKCPYLPDDKVAV
jgi:mannose-6-phosphate isomerase-like protein (cupin superfamily)